MKNCFCAGFISGHLASLSARINHFAGLIWAVMAWDAAKEVLGTAHTIEAMPMTDAETLALLDRILSGDRPDEEFGQWIEQLKKATGCPNILNLIKYRTPADTSQTILRMAREYRPIQL